MDGDRLLEHVVAIAARSAADADRVAARALDQAWPGGHHDRTDSAALEWVRRWRPSRAAIEPLMCGCATGRCRLCN